MANYFRLYLHAAAHNLLVRLRRAVACPPPPPSDSTLHSDVPTEALDGAARRRYFTHRRQADSLGEGHPCTWRSLLIKVAAEVTVSTRRILVRLSSTRARRSVPTRHIPARARNGRHRSRLRRRRPLHILNKMEQRKSWLV